MNNYEMMFIVRPDVDEETLAASREKVQTIIAEHNGQISEEKDMGKRRLAYIIPFKQGSEPIKYTEGYYTVYNFTATTDVVDELNRVVNIDDKFLRHLVINLAEK
jgi:small subunit ribosomal protein S6